MLIKELRKHFPARAPEWWNAGTMFAWGAYILLNPGIFNNNIFDGFVAIANGWSDIPDRLAAERMWGLITVTVGLLRGCALFVNGSYSRTPMIRLVCSAVSAFIWCQVVIGLLQLPVPTTGVVVYCSLMGLDLISAYRAAVDAAIAESTRRAGEGGKKRVISAGYGSLGVQ